MIEFKVSFLFFWVFSQVAVINVGDSEEKNVPREFIENYVKSNYRVVGERKHTAIKPCYWLEQKLQTGRSNRNCYKGYWGIDSELCIQNTPAYPFCNHSCVFCWRDTSVNLDTEFSVQPDNAKHIVKELIRHQRNMINYNYPLEKFLKNYDLMQEILECFWKQGDGDGDGAADLSEMSMSLNESASKTAISRAILLLKNTDMLVTEDLESYSLSEKAVNFLHEHTGDVKALLAKFVTTKDEIHRVHENALNPRHAAISLDGEPTLFPHIGEMVREFRKLGFTTFIVTNGTTPDVLKNLDENEELPTILYVTIPAPNEEAYKYICRPRIPGTWQKILKTLDMLKTLKTRTVIRITSVKNLNNNSDLVPEYVALINRAAPDFVDIKGFTLEGGSMNIAERLNSDTLSNEYVPSFSDLMKFADELGQNGGYKIIETHEKSRDILLRAEWPEGKSIKITPEQV